VDYHSVDESLQQPKVLNAGGNFPETLQGDIFDQYGMADTCGPTPIVARISALEPKNLSVARILNTVGERPA